MLLTLPMLITRLAISALSGRRLRGGDGGAGEHKGAARRRHFTSRRVRALPPDDLAEFPRLVPCDVFCLAACFEPVGRIGSFEPKA